VKYITRKNIAKIGNYHRSKCCYTKNITKLKTSIVQNAVSCKKTLQNWKLSSFKMLLFFLDLCPNAHTSHSVCVHVYITSAISHQWESYTFLQGLYYYFFLNQMLYIFTRFLYYCSLQPFNVNAIHFYKVILLHFYRH